MNVITFAIAINKTTLVLYGLPSQKTTTTTNTGFIMSAIAINKKKHGFIAFAVGIHKKHWFYHGCHRNQTKHWFYNVCHRNKQKHIGFIAFAIAIDKTNIGFIIAAIAINKTNISFIAFASAIDEHTLVL